MMMTWKEKHNHILENKIDIVKRYKEGITLEEIANIYKVSKKCIWNNINKWGLLKRHGIKYLLGKCFREI
jgi:predicted DNA-binding protein YlxM (UPF0122 family)